MFWHCEGVESGNCLLFICIVILLFDINWKVLPQLYMFLRFPISVWVSTLEDPNWFVGTRVGESESIWNKMAIFLPARAENHIGGTNLNWKKKLYCIIWLYVTKFDFYCNSFSCSSDKQLFTKWKLSSMAKLNFNSARSQRALSFHQSNQFKAWLKHCQSDLFSKNGL